MNMVKAEELSSTYLVVTRLSGPISVSFDITNRCNLKCLHCYNDSGSGSFQELSDAEVLEVTQQISELHPFSVCLCGGETLCRKNILEILDILKDNVGAISMVSNGYLMTEQLAMNLKMRKLQQVQISLDGVNKYQHDSFRQVKGAFDKAVNAIKILKKVGMRAVATSLVPNKLNFKTIDQYIELCYELGVDVIRIMPYIPSGRGRTVGSNLLLNNMEYFIFLRKMQDKIKEMENKIIVEWGDPLDHMRRMPFNAKHGLKAYCMEIKANGDLTPTTYLPIVVGNCKRYTLKEYWDRGYGLIWNNKSVLKYVEKVKTVYDFEDFEPKPYSGEKILVDLI